MTDNVTQLPQPPKRDLIAEMKGPENSGNAVIIDGRCIPNCVMYDRGGEIEFVLDNRLAFSFPREQAWNAAYFAFVAMALGAGFAHPAHMHYTQRPFSAECVQLNKPDLGL